MSRAASKITFCLLFALSIGGCEDPLTHQVPPPGSTEMGQPAAAFVQVGNDLRGHIQQVASGQDFPNLVGGFIRISTRVYDGTGRDVSVGYKYAVMHTPIVGTVYVFPAHGPVAAGASNDDAAAARAEFERQKASVAAAHAGSILLQEEASRLTVNGASLAGWRATYNFTDQFNGSFGGGPAARQPLGSELYVYCCVNHAWALQYRFTYPTTVAARLPIDRFMQALRIDIPPAGG